VQIDQLIRQRAGAVARLEIAVIEIEFSEFKILFPQSLLIPVRTPRVPFAIPRGTGGLFQRSKLSGGKRTEGGEQSEIAQ
jgi:hypothetical protein